MDFLYSSGYITVLEVGLLLFLGTVANLLRRPRVGLIVNCFFTLYWCFFLNSGLFFDSFEQSGYSFVYFGFTLVILVMTVMGLTQGE